MGSICSSASYESPNSSHSKSHVYKTTNICSDTHHNNHSIQGNNILSSNYNSGHSTGGYLSETESSRQNSTTTATTIQIRVTSTNSVSTKQTTSSGSKVRSSKESETNSSHSSVSTSSHKAQIPHSISTSNIRVQPVEWDPIAFAEMEIEKRQKDPRTSTLRQSLEMFRFPSRQALQMEE
ncbi:hypothetical protein C9374_014443 [Naegleria lovaniensis]|uniref:Uncharacterized protein n=1 Tax=Naegleria lovaniensis TaxID=51637 RepID=A0AA88GZ33_NAELO|nr:uncharacterized protein C9374_014443 [Naegleria lovaniensis]KAG2389043.1 hypothetical protein C9374_014443 [Naegleria lovaniensis]